MQSEAMRKGRELEQRIAQYFSLNGYRAETNVILTGRSGGRHEIDVLADRSDGVTSVRLMVECKAWAHPIPKDVVAKVDYVLRDLGLNKAIVVALEGWQVGAEQAARELGVELWGPGELQQKLGQVSVAGVRSAGASRQAIGLAPSVTWDQADRVLRSKGGGVLGMGREEIVGEWLGWIPFFCLELGCSRHERQVLRGTTLKTRTLWNLYEGLGGSLLLSWDSSPGFGPVQMGAVVPPLAKPREMIRDLDQAVRKYGRLVQPQARQRQAAKLQRLGIPVPTERIAVDSVQDVHLPFYLALLHRKGAQRIAAVDGVWGLHREGLSRVLTAHRTYVVEALNHGTTPGASSGPGEPDAPAYAYSPARQTLPVPPRPDLG